VIENPLISTKIRCGVTDPAAGDEGHAPEASFYLWPSVDDDERFTRELSSNSM